MAYIDDLLGRQQAARNPLIGTDRGLNSVSPYLMATGQTSSDGWASTNDSIASSLAQGAASVKAASALKASQAAATAAAQQNAATQAAAAAASAKSAANQRTLAAAATASQTALQGQIDSLNSAVAASARNRQTQQDAAASEAASKANLAANHTGVKTKDIGKGQKTVAGAGGKDYSTSKGLDTQSANAERLARAYGYNLGAANYSKTYNSNPNLSAARNKAMMLATSYLGTRYQLDGESHASIDCSGLVQAVYQQLGFKVPTHSAADQGQTGGRSNGNGMPGQRVAWGSSKLQPGDIIAWKDGSHIAIYAGGGKIIEAANEKVGTVERPLWDSGSNVVGIHLNI